MRRLRTACRVLAELKAEFGPDKRARRERALAKMAADPHKGMIFAAFSKGPDRVPAEAFSPEAISEFLN